MYHAAAYKHVPMMELYPCEAVRTNVEGTRNVLEAARAAGCEAFVLISTDKAVNPSSIMGATKRVAEALVRDADHAAAREPAAQSVSTRSLAVRFGNVLGSRGSVLGTFQAQVQARQPVTVTHPAMERYFMVTSEAVQLVLEASAVGKSGQVLVLDMGEPVKIVDLARDVIRFYGLEPDVDVPIVYTGVRPGEKLFEELLTAEEGTDKTDFARLFVARMQEPPLGWRDELDALVRAAHADDAVGVREALEAARADVSAGRNPGKHTAEGAEDRGGLKGRTRNCRILKTHASLDSSCASAFLSAPLCDLCGSGFCVPESSDKLPPQRAQRIAEG